MELTLYKNHSAPEVVNKTLTNALSFSGSILENDDGDVLNPNISISTNISLPLYDYAYIADYQRYYYMHVEPLYKDFYKVKMSVDPLMSWKNDISNIIAIIDKQESNNDRVTNKMINDGTFINPENEAIDVLSFPNKLLQYTNGKETYHYIMVHV